MITSESDSVKQIDSDFENFWADSNFYANQITIKSVKGFLKSKEKIMIFCYTDML